MTMSPEGTVLIDGKPLGFYHFSGYDSDAGWKMVRHLFEDEQHCIYDIWEWYLGKIKEYGQETLGKSEWAYARFSNGESITDEMRKVYRARPDLELAFPNPFAVRPGEPSFYQWWADSSLVKAQ